MEKIKICKHEDINPIYDRILKIIIHKSLFNNSKKRPNIEEILNYFSIEKQFEKIENLFQNDKVYQNYLLEKNISNSMKIVREILEYKLLRTEDINFLVKLIFINISNINFAGLWNFIKLVIEKNSKYDAFELNSEFLRVNSIIMKENAPKKFNGKYWKTSWWENSKGKDCYLWCTLINEFLKLDNSKRAKESEGGPTDTVDFTPYKGQNNNKTYFLYDTNGITNIGKDSIEFKKENIKKEITKRLQSHNPNQLIHCIWYCFEGSNIKPSDKDFIENLLNIYSTYSIPIVYIHTQSISKKQSETCKKGIEKYMMEIYNNDELKVKQQLNNYINIIARDYEEEKIKAYGLDELEKLTYKEIKEKGIKSSFFEYITHII